MRGVWGAVASSAVTLETTSKTEAKNYIAKTCVRSGSDPHSRFRWTFSTHLPANIARSGASELNTPLQALMTLNDPQFVEVSRFLAQGAMKETGDHFDRRRLDHMTM